MMNYWRACFACVVVFAIVSSFLWKGTETLNERRVLGGLFPDIEIPQKTGSPPHYRLSDELVAVNTIDIAPHIQGYGGPLSVLVVLRRDGRIVNLRMLSHRETENYVHYLFSEEFLKTFVGKSAGDAFQVGRDVDAVSRATVSEEALCRAISISTKKVAREVFGLEIKEEGRTSKALSIKPLVFSAWFVFVVVYYLLTKRNKGLLRFRNLILLGSVLIMGVYLSTFFSIIHFIQILRGEISFRWQWLMVVLFTAVSFLVLGRFYCGWLCPFGAINELTGQKLPRWNPSDRYDLRLRGLKYLVLIVLTGGVCFGLRAVHIDFEPYLTLFSFRGNLFTWGIVIIALLAGLKLPRPWCRYLCPVGALSGLFERPQKGYMGMKGCPVGLKEYVSGECIRCNRCYQKR